MGHKIWNSVEAEQLCQPIQFDSKLWVMKKLESHFYLNSGAVRNHSAMKRWVQIDWITHLESKVKWWKRFVWLTLRTAKSSDFRPEAFRRIQESMMAAGWFDLRPYFVLSESIPSLAENSAVLDWILLHWYQLIVAKYEITLVVESCFGGAYPGVGDIPLAARDEISSSESKVSNMSCPPLPAIRKTKDCSIRRSRCGSGALTGSLFLNVMMCPLIGDKVTQSIKRSLSSSGVISMLAGSISIPSSLGFLKCWRIYRILAFNSSGQGSSFNGSRINVPKAQKLCASAERVSMLWRLLIRVFEAGIVVLGLSKMSCWSFSFRSLPQKMSRTLQRSMVDFCCVFPSE